MFKLIFRTITMIMFLIFLTVGLVLEGRGAFQMGRRRYGDHRGEGL